ncbi:UNVERIFIED_CONTAM: hypothetical protein K2H54_033749 [Gekko kuhli]
MPHPFSCSHIYISSVFNYDYTWKFQQHSEPFQVPIIIPIVVLVTSVYLVLVPIIDQPQIEFLYVILFIFSGVIFYFPLVYYQYHPAFLRSFTLHLQLLLEVAPAEKNVN